MMKLAVNLPVAVVFTGRRLGEALTICKPLNLPADRLIDIFVRHRRYPDRDDERAWRSYCQSVLGGSPEWGE